MKIVWAVATLLVLALGLSACDRSLPEPARETVHFPVAEAARAAGDYPTAIDAYRRSIAAEPYDPRSYYGLVECFVRQGNPEDVRSLLDAYGKADPKNACVHYGLGCLAVRLQDLDTGLAEAEEVLRLDPTQGHGYLLMGSVHYYAGRSPEALEAWNQAAGLFRRQGDLKYEAWSLNRTGVVRRELGEYEEALADYERACSLQRALGNAEAVQLILGNIGLTQGDLGDLDQALDTFEEAIDMARVSGDRYSECWGQTNLSYLYNLAGDHRRAIDYADSATALAYVLDSPDDILAGRQARATACIHLGDAVGALTTVREAQLLADSLADHRQLAGLLATEGRACIALGRLERARAAYRKADSLFARMGTIPGSWEAQIGLSEIDMCAGDSAAAISQAQRAHAACAEAGYAEGEEFTALLLSDLELGRGAPVAAAEWAGQAVRLSRRDGRRMREAWALAKRAQAELAGGDHAAALNDARRSSELAGDIHSPELTWQCNLALGDVLAQENPQAAIEHYFAAMNAVEMVGQGLRLEVFRAAYLARRLALYRKTAELLVKLGRNEDAFSVCERSRARAFKDLLTASPTLIPQHIPPDLQKRRTALDSRLRRLQSTRARLAGMRGANRQRIAGLDRAIRSAKIEWEDLRADILLQCPQGSRSRAGFDPPDLEDLIARLGPNDAILEYALCSARSFCFVIRSEGMQVVPLEVGDAQVSRWVGRFLQPLQSPRSLTTLGFDRVTATMLRAELVDPVLPHLSHVQHLMIVPDGPLHSLPFEALVLGDNRDPVPSAAGRQSSSAPDTLYRSLKRVRFLADEFEIEYLPSAQLLAVDTAQSGTATETTSRSSLLAMGGSDCPGAFGGAATLRHADAELHTIAQLFPDAVVETGERATETRFAELAPRFRYLHLCSHGTLDEEVPLYSGVQLASGSGDDGFLHAHEVLGLNLNCDLVTLSACQTGRGRLYAGEGVLGLTRSFLYAGARQALVSLWSVGDASTTHLMASFYTELSRGESTAAALRHARQELRKEGWVTEDGSVISYAHPFFWAGFILTSRGVGR